MQTAEEFLEDQFGKGNWVAMDAVTIKARDAQVREAALREATAVARSDYGEAIREGVDSASAFTCAIEAILALIEKE